MTLARYAAFVAASIACTGPSKVAPAVVAPSNTARGPLTQPYVLVVTAPKPCSNGQADISGVVDEDAKYSVEKLSAHLRAPGSGDLGATGTVLSHPSAQEIKEAVEELAKAGKLVAGLVLLFTGHGFREVGDGVERSMLCLRDGPDPARDLVGLGEGVPLDAFPWLAMILNACESAYVDLAVSPRPTAVLSASPREISVHAFPNPKRPAGSCRPPSDGGPRSAQPTPLVVATVNALAEPADPNHDRNEDGIVTIHELFHVLTDAAARGWHGCSGSEPDPKFQLQARSEIPVRFHDRAVDTRRDIAAIVDILLAEPPSAGRDALVAAIRAQLDLATKRVLPEIRWDFVISSSVDIAARVPTLAAAGAAEQPCWGHPLQLAMLPATLPLEAQRALGRFAIFSSFYEFQVDGTNVDIVALYEQTSGKKSALRALSMREALSGIPARIDAVDSRTYRATTAVPNAEQCRHSPLQPALQNRDFRVCPEEEGQCFAH